MVKNKKNKKNIHELIHKLLVPPTGKKKCFNLTVFTAYLDENCTGYEYNPLNQYTSLEMSSTILVVRCMELVHSYLSHCRALVLCMLDHTSQSHHLSYKLSYLHRKARFIRNHLSSTIITTHLSVLFRYSTNCIEEQSKGSRIISS